MYIAGIFAFLSFGEGAFGAITACATTSPGNAINGLGNQGCAEIDKAFTNLTIESSTGAAPSANDIFIFATGTAPVGNTIGPVSLFFNTPGPGPTWSVSDGASMSQTVDFEVTANTGGTFNGGTYPTPATPGKFWAINQIVLTPSVSITNFGGGTANNGTVTLAFCLNATTTTGCSAGASGTIVATYSGTTTAVYSCTFSGCVSGTSNTINLGGAVTQIALAESLTINAATPTGNSFTINQIQNQFGEFAAAPEPSTWLLVGGGLLCFALLARRRAPP